MESKDYSQMELFQQIKNRGSEPHARHSFLTFIWQYEKVILILLGFIVTGVISFCFGVEKGKRLASNQKVKPEIIRQETLPSSVTNTEKAIAPLKQAETTEAVIAKQPQPKETNLGNYTIQVATYQNKKSAQREADTLKKKGLNPSVLTKSGYSIVCIGKFVNREKAKSVLTEIRKSYSDSYIRRL